MKTYYDITVKTTNGDTFQLKGVSFSMMMQLANQSDSIHLIEIKKEYSKKISKY